MAVNEFASTSAKDYLDPSLLDSEDEDEMLELLDRTEKQLTNTSDGTGITHVDQSLLDSEGEYEMLELLDRTEKQLTNTSDGTGITHVDQSLLDSEGEYEMLELLDRTEKQLTNTSDGTGITHVDQSLLDSEGEYEMCRLLDETEKAYRSIDDTYFSATDNLKLYGSRDVEPIPLYHSTPKETNCEAIVISSDSVSEPEMQDKLSDTSRDDIHADSDSFDHLFGPTPTPPMPSGFELMHRTPKSESFTEFDLLSGTFDSSSGGNEQLDITSDSSHSVIVISSESEGERDFSDISDVAELETSNTP
ncbi:hypothetical protein Bbelb_427590 [Branchiostoma belcheri]|nr:hypothetical protein Bbelb_427590 [Branchiostoma belcheri]